MKQIGYYHCFPFQEVQQGETVVIWGMGEVGQHYLKQLQHTGYCNVAFAVDANWKNIHVEGISVVSPSHIQGLSDMPIVIANGSKSAAKSILLQLQEWGVEYSRIIWQDMIIEEEMVVDEAVADIGNNNAIKRVGYYHILPFHEIKRGEKIIIWGMGEVGRHYLAQIKATGYCQVASAVDKNWKRLKGSPISVDSPDKIREMENHRILIASGSAEYAVDIQASLEEMGVEKERIIWNDIIISGALVVREILGDNKNGKAPYLGGSESSLSQRAPIARFVTRFMEYDIVSFDIFDTLIFRPFARPEDLFMFLEIKHHYLGFAKIRVEAEKRAREMARITRSTDEVTLEEIYKFVERETGLDAGRGCEIEIATEMEFCFANPYMMEVYRILREQGKRLVFVSNMYLKREHMIKLLHKCGYEGICAEDVFVSCDYSTSKGGDGGLFRLVRNIFGKKLRYVHVGDNWKVDIVNAKKNGFSAIYYRNVNQIGNHYRATYSGMSALVGSAYAGIVNAHLHNGLGQYDVPYEYGYICGGLYMLGYASWIQEYAENHHVDKVLFLARDGDVLQQVFRMLPTHVSSSYALWSRRISTVLYASQDRHSFLNRLVRDPMIRVGGLQIGDWLDMLNLSSLQPKMQGYPVSLKQEIDSQAVGVLEQFVIEHWDEILACCEKEDKAARLYFKSLLGTARNVAVVDIGWTGNCTVKLQWLLEKKWKLCDRVHCLQAGCVTPNVTDVVNIQSGKVHAYLFSPVHNRNLYNFHKKRMGLNHLFFEFLSQSPSPSFCGFSLEGEKLKLKYALPETENKDVIQKIQEGIREFASAYLQHFSHATWMYHISGQDAYHPFRLIADYPQYFKKYFSEQTFIEGLADNPNSIRSRTIREIMNSKGL